jgi:hypothetical protein
MKKENEGTTELGRKKRSLKGEDQLALSPKRIRT